MSWHFRKVGTDRAALKAAVRQEHAPAAILDEVCARIDGAQGWTPHVSGSMYGEEIKPGGDLPSGYAIVVFTTGHLDPSAERPFKGLHTMEISVELVRLHTGASS
jgi:hypothetical protein